ncbi:MULTISPECIES: hypothetical protein [Caproicibacterium]|uniref:Uncharacterized protein n=1 Tax=Caproicibacterium argilliputei TaxID=3030016 RepID=A0AA97D8B1_9FIRM|nr:hypothetical protein [Caproicibacterium argilliputei]WOC32179.1 hypothetical protein PXC00_13465 [Caproicibacterium argilliputei]
MKNRRKRTFACAFAGTLLVLLLLAGLGGADVICRHMTYADGRTLYESRIRPLLSWQGSLCKFTDLWYNQFVDFVCPEALED